MSVEIVFETHSTSTDNEAGKASGLRDVALSDLGRTQAAELGERRRATTDAVFCSDLLRAVQTAEIAFAPDVPITTDARLREQDYGDRTGAPSTEIEIERLGTVDTPFPNGESLRQCAARVSSLLDEIAPRYVGKRVLLIGHRATKLTLDHLLGGMSLEEAAGAEYAWEPGWTYTLR